MYDQECFALLGVNGAGKSSTFKILTNEIEKTSGTVKVMEYDIDTERREITKNMGYCPQHDALFDQMTVEEHLKFYGKVRCLENLDEHVKFLIDALQL